jgi:murein DD-endopeptidase MepM/ murein hydrolase activator NlpD
MGLAASRKKTRAKQASGLAAAVLVVLSMGLAFATLMRMMLDTERVVERPARNPQPRAEIHVSDSRVGERDEAPAPKPQVAAPPAADEVVTLLWPIREARLSSGFGYRVNPITGDDQLHRGVDVPAPCGTEVLAVEEGTVVFSDWLDASGNTVKIEHDGGWYTTYMHLSRIAVRSGQHVKAGQRIALSGDTGRMTTGAHLHFEVSKGKSAKNPMAFRYRLPAGKPTPVAKFASCGRAPAARARAMKAPGPSVDSADRKDSVEAIYASLVGSH